MSVKLRWHVLPRTLHVQKDENGETARHGPTHEKTKKPWRRIVPEDCAQRPRGNARGFSSGSGCARARVRARYAHGLMDVASLSRMGMAYPDTIDCSFGPVESDRAAGFCFQLLEFRGPPPSSRGPPASFRAPVWVTELRVFVSVWNSAELTLLGKAKRSGASASFRSSIGATRCSSSPARRTTAAIVGLGPGPCDGMETR